MHWLSLFDENDDDDNDLLMGSACNVGRRPSIKSLLRAVVVVVSRLLEGFDV
jgi:hypothetical protein